MRLFFYVCADCTNFCHQGRFLPFCSIFIDFRVNFSCFFHSVKKGRRAGRPAEEKRSVHQNAPQTADDRRYPELAPSERDQNAGNIAAGVYLQTNAPRSIYAGVIAPKKNATSQGITTKQTARHAASGSAGHSTSRFGRVWLCFCLDFFRFSSVLALFFYFWLIY